MAQNNLALTYLKGTGVERDIPAAEKYLRLAAHNGSTVAAKNLAQLYRRGVYFAQDYRLALKYFKLAPEENDSRIWLSILWDPIWEEGTHTASNTSNTFQLGL